MNSDDNANEKLSDTSEAGSSAPAPETPQAEKPKAEKPTPFKKRREGRPSKGDTNVYCGDELWMPFGVWSHILAILDHWKQYGVFHAPTRVFQSCDREWCVSLSEDSRHINISTSPLPMESVELDRKIEVLRVHLQKMGITDALPDGSDEATATAWNDLWNLRERKKALDAGCLRKRLPVELVQTRGMSLVVSEHGVLSIRMD